MRFLSSMAAALMFATVSYGATITYVRVESTDNFLGWGQSGFYFPQFNASRIVGPKRTDDNMQFFVPHWLEFNFDPFDLLSTTFSPDKPDCFDDCRGRGVYTRGGYPKWAVFTLPNGLSGRSGSIVDEQAENNTNNTVNRIRLKSGAPASFCLHIVTDNTAHAHDSKSIIVRGGRAGDESFDPRLPIPNLTFDGRTDVHTFRFDDFVKDDFIKIRLNSGTPGIAPGFGGLMFDLSCGHIPNAQCGNTVCDFSLGESCESCPGDCGACIPGAAPAGTWYHHGANPQSHYEQGSNRLLLFVAHGVDAVNHRVEAVKYGDRNMHLLRARSQARNEVATVSVWYLKEAEIASATGSDFTVDWLRKPGDRSYESIFFSNTSQTAPFGAIEEAGCNDCFALSCPADTIEPAHLSVYAGTHERDGVSFSPGNGYTQDADLPMGGNGRATLGRKAGVGQPESASAEFGREGAFSLVCLEVQDLPRTAGEDDDDDGDGLSNGRERMLGTLSNDRDTDDDGLDDGAEVDVYGTDPRAVDSDRDGIPDGLEILLGINPAAADSDNDGLDDAFELSSGLNPNDASDCPGYICGGGNRGWRLQLLQQAR